MYTIEERRKELALTGAAMVGMVIFFLLCLLLPWWVIEAISPWLAIPVAVAAALAWARWGLFATGGPSAVLSRILVFGVNGLVIFVAFLRILGW